MHNASKPQSHARLCCELWAGVLGAPFIWLIQLQTNYALVPWVCAHGKRQVIAFSSLFFACLATVAGIFALRGYRSQEKQRVSSIQSGQFEIINFMARVGLLVSALFILLIILQAVPLFIIDPCVE